MWEAEIRSQLPATRIHQTKGGGRHWVFRHAPGVRNSGGMIAPGVDVRGEGGYIIVPPSAGYSVTSAVEPAEWPDWLLALILERPDAKLAAIYSGPSEPISDRLLSAIRVRALDRVRSAGEGQKHFSLRNQALVLGGIQERARFGY